MAIHEHDLNEGEYGPEQLASIKPPSKLAHAFHNMGNTDESAHNTLHEIIDRELASDVSEYNNGIVCDVCGVVFKRS